MSDLSKIFPGSVSGSFTGSLAGTAETSSFAESAATATLADLAATATLADTATTSSFSSTASLADVAKAAPVTLVLYPGEAGEFLELSLDEELEELALRTLVDLTGFKEARFVANVVDHENDLYIAIQYSFDHSLTQPEASWSLLDGSGGPRANINGTGIKTDGWFPITGSAKTDVVLRAVASGVFVPGGPAKSSLGMMGLFVR